MPYWIGRSPGITFAMSMRLVLIFFPKKDGSCFNMGSTVQASLLRLSVTFAVITTSTLNSSKLKTIMALTLPKILKKIIMVTDMQKGKITKHLVNWKSQWQLVEVSQ